MRHNRPNRWLRGSLVAALLAAPAASAQPTAAQAPSPVFRTQQELNARLFAEFKAGLLRLAQKLQRSDRPEDLERAKTILAALDLAAKENVDSQFQKLLGNMSRGTGNVAEVQGMIGQDQQLQKVLQEILSVLMTDDESARLKNEIARLEAHLKSAKEIKRLQEVQRSLSEQQRADAERLAKQQRDLAERTRELAERMGGKPKKADKPGGQAGPKEPEKSEPKSAAKDGDEAGRDKPDTAENKGDPKDADGKPADPQAKGGPVPPKKADAPTQGEPKDGVPEPADAKGGPPPEKPGESAEGKPAGGDDMPPGKPGDKSAAEAKKPDAPKLAEPGEAKPADAAQAEKPRPADAKPSEQAQSKAQGAGKGESKPAQGDQGGEAKPPQEQQGQQSAQGKPSQSPPKPGGGESQEGEQNAGQPQPPQPPPAPGRKRIEEALPFQDDAAKKLKQNDRKQAGKGQDKAIEELAQAIQELEKKLRQLREEEALKVLAGLEARVNNLLKLQTDVYEATKGIDAAAQRAGGTKGPSEIQKAQQQSDAEGKIVEEADKALKLLEAEASAVAFAQVLQEVRGDMQAVQRLLGGADAGRDTQALEENILAMLKDMAAAVKKAQQDLQQQQQAGGGGGGGGGEQQKPLVDLLSELRLIRALQMQVNQRTTGYGVKSAAEQAADPFLRGEIQQLSDRQEKLQEMVRKIVTGENK